MAVPAQHRPVLQPHSPSCSLLQPRLPVSGRRPACFRAHRQRCRAGPAQRQTAQQAETDELQEQRAQQEADLAGKRAPEKMFTVHPSARMSQDSRYFIASLARRV